MPSSRNPSSKAGFPTLGLSDTLLSAVTAFATIAMGFRARAQGRPSARWLCSAAILTLPLVLVLGPLG